MAAESRSYPRLAGALLLALTACSPIEPDSSAWSALLAPAGRPADAVGGSVSAISRGVGTRASIQITGATEGETYQWRIREESCDAPGDLVGGRASYPVLRVGANGVAVGDAQLSEKMRADGTYQATVLRGVEGDTAIAACAALAPA